MVALASYYKPGIRTTTSEHQKGGREAIRLLKPVELVLLIGKVKSSPIPCR